MEAATDILGCPRDQRDHAACKSPVALGEANAPVRWRGFVYAELRHLNLNYFTGRA